ncbi:MAG: GNAT family N-acetyltransferase [Clostridia bacterium]|nr:GNAT family N-acetyltransferase [Clostridia bacterium]
MELHVKRFDELTVYELYEILKLRSSVFVVEQQSRYLDMDDKDQDALHVFMTHGGELAACLRILSKGFSPGEVKITRVISAKRHAGTGSAIVREGIRIAKSELGAKRIKIAAQTYTKEFYERLGFVKVSDEYLIDEIPHINMILE